jgi:hypothetical protein
MDFVAAFLFTDDNLQSQPTGSILALARERTLLLKVASQAAPRADHRPAVEARL